MNIEWLIDCKPRDVQIEAILRSFYGYRSRDNKNDLPSFEKLRDGPALGWGHMLEMRLGKTPTTFNEYALFQKHYDINKMIVFSPNSYKKAWVSEASKFGITTPFMMYEATNVKGVLEFLKKNKDEYGLVVNYESVRTENCFSILNDLIGQDVFLVADESIKIKNPSSSTAKAVLELAKGAKYTRELTGCPMTQGPQDMFTQLKFVKALNGKNFYSFRNRYCKMGGFKNKQVVGPKNEDELNELINSHAFVAKRKDWANPTNPEYYTVDLELHPEQARYYREMDNEFIAWLSEDVKVTVDQVISKMLKLQQISSGFIYDEHGDAIDLMDLRETPKMKRLLEMMEEEITSKVVVAFHYQKSGDALREALAKYKPAVIRSKQWMKNRDLDVEAEKARFNSDPECRVMLAQISASKYGHDLSGMQGDRCTTMIFYENTFSLDDRIQIEMRNTTATQDWSNVYFDFVATPVEANAIKALEKKENIVTAVLGAYNPDKTRSHRQ